MNRELNKYDILKALAILLVVFGHITILYNQNQHPEIDTVFWEKVTLAIYIFHMPLFMAISGAIYQIGFSKGKYRGFSNFVHSKLLRIIVPYICIGLFVLIPTLVICNNEMGFMQPSIYWKMLFGIDNKHLWFLLALFWIFLFQYAADYVKIPTWLLFCIASIASSIMSIFDVWSNVLDISHAIRYWPYFILGILVQDIVNFLQPKRGALVSILGAITCGIGCYVSNNLAVDYILSFMLPCFIVIILNIIADILMRGMSSSKWIGIIADYSFAIYLFHISVIFIIHHFYGSCDPFLLIPAMFIFAMFVPVVIVMLIRKCRLQFIIGERNGK